MEKLADGLQRLGEDDLLQVVQMVHDNKTNDTYTKNDVESELLNQSPKKKDPCTIRRLTYCSDGEFHVDLYTLPDSLVKMLWDFTASKTEL